MANFHLTHEEAIKNINALNAVCGQKDLYDVEFESALALAIDALEKQTPKKPIEKFQVPYDSLECGLCHSCNEGVNSDMDFCSVCGQAIDWGDSNA